MKSRRSKPYDLLAAGELLVDMVSTNFAENLDSVSAFKRMQGGSPANMCMNMSRLGNQTALVATVGNDDMGQFLERSVVSTGVDGHQIRRSDIPTTLILVTRSREISNFEVYRGADADIRPEQLPQQMLADCTIFHTTCFGLSQEPAQGQILQAAELAVNNGATLSIDANYAQKVWSDTEQARAVVRDYVSGGALVKISEVDWERLYGKPLREPQEALDHFRELGASLVCLTLGGEGAWVGDGDGAERISGRKVEVKDTTGAGDAFWSGFLTAWLDGYDKVQCALAGRSMAELKLKHFGPLPSKVKRELLYEFRDG